MAYSHTLVMKLKVLLLLFTTICSSSTTSSRPIVIPPSSSNTGSINNSVEESMLRRLKLTDETPINCWATMFELQSCTGEVIQFFYEGQTYLGPGCCRAIRVIEHHCWPNMLATLGFTSEEGDILEGYCDNSEEHLQNGN